jgi:hypothetical protein
MVENFVRNAENIFFFKILDTKVKIKDWPHRAFKKKSVRTSHILNKSAILNF